MDNRTFDPVDLLDTIEREGVNTMAMVGDAFGKPILRTLDENPGRWDLTSLVGIVSSGVMWSKETKEGLLRHHPNMMLMDAFSSSEALGMGSSISGAGATADTAKFELSPETIVIDDLNRPIAPGTGEVGTTRGRWTPTDRVLQGRGEDGEHLLRDRRHALFVPRRLRDRRRRRPDHPAGPWLGVHQHRWREGVPRGGRGSDEDAPRCARRRCGRSSRRAIRRGGHRRGRSRDPGRRSTPMR